MKELNGLRKALAGAPKERLVQGASISGRGYSVRFGTCAKNLGSVGTHDLYGTPKQYLKDDPTRWAPPLADLIVRSVNLAPHLLQVAEAAEAFHAIGSYGNHNALSRALDALKEAAGGGK